MGQSQFFQAAIEAAVPDPAYYTNARGAALDRLINDLTAIRAGKLDNLDIAVSNAKNAVSVQRGQTILSSGTQLDIVISPIDVAKSFVTVCIRNADGAGSNDVYHVTAHILDSVTLRLTRYQAGVNYYCIWEVVQIA